MRVPVCEPEFGQGELNNVIDCMRSGQISGYAGRYLDEFEDRFSEYCGCEYGVATTSCATAMLLTLESLGIGKGDEVITSAFTMIATVNAIIKAGAKPVLVDCEPETWNINPYAIVWRITPKTKAIMPVHIYGLPCEMDYISGVADKHGLYVIEDAAEAIGAKYHGKRAGGLGTAGCFSFYINKTITTGSGGMITTNDRELANKAQLLKSYATNPEKRFTHDYIGFNFRLTNLQASIGVAQMDKIDEFVGKKRWVARRYTERLRDVGGLFLPRDVGRTKNAYWVYALLVEDEFGVSRDELRQGLADKGVETRTFFVPMNKQPALNNIGLFRNEQCPVAEDISQRGLYLPNGVGLTAEQIDYVCDCIKEVGG